MPKEKNISVAHDPAQPVSTARWLTPPAPAAIGLVAIRGAFPGCFDRAWPELEQHRFGRLKNQAGETVDEIVAVRIAADELWLCTHGGPGIRAAVTDLLTNSHVTFVDQVDTTSLGAALATASGPAATQWLLEHLAKANDATAAIPDTGFPTAFLSRRPRLLLTGPANAGKSALLNAWCGYRRAVVSPMPGTTRDLVAAVVNCHGWHCEVLDSAGLRPTDDRLESAGQDLAQEARNWVDAVLYLAPADQPDARAAAAAGDLIIVGKADLYDLTSDLKQNTNDCGSRLLWQAPEAGDAVRSEALLTELASAVCQHLQLPPAPSTLRFH